MFHYFCKEVCAMRQVRKGIFSVLLVFGLVGGATAEMNDPKKGTTDEMNQTSTGTSQSLETTEEGDKHQAIESQGATKRESIGINQDREVPQQDPARTTRDGTVTQQEPPVGIVDQLREGAKGEVNRRGRDINEQIDRFGQ
jgi:hypothetical protein